MISSILRRPGAHDVQVNDRTEGGWGLYQSLHNQIKTWRFDVYKPYDRGTDRTVNVEGDYVRVTSGLDYLGSFYVSFLTPIADTLIARILLSTSESRTNQTKTATLPDRTRINSCLDQLASRYKKGTKISFTSVAAENGTWVFSFEMNGSPYSIRINGTEYNSDQLGRMYEADNHLKQSGRKEPGYVGYASQLGNKVNGFIAVDVAARVATDLTEIGLAALALHETGNGVAVAVINSLTNEERSKVQKFWRASEPTAQDDTDPGTGFERCLFNGIVSLKTGTVGNTRW